MTTFSAGRGLIAHEWVESIGGSENVVDVFARMWPDSDLYSLWLNAPERYPQLRHFESRLARSPMRRHKALALPFMSSQWRSADLREYDWALISTHAFAHHLGVGPLQRHLRRFIYVHTPARYLWADDIDPRGRHPIVRTVAPLLRRQDRRHVGPGAFAANSQFVRERMRRAWGVDSVVIHPPVAVSQIQGVERWADTLDAQERRALDALPEDYLVGASRFVGYKGLATVLDYAAETDRAVVIAGRGPEEPQLRARARQLGLRANFVVSPSDRLLRAVIQGASAFIYPPVEDFGIIAAESVALGTPAIVNTVGGAKEIVEKTGGGVAVDFSRSSEWTRALRSLEDLSLTDAAARAKAFAEEAFEAEILDWMESRS